MNCAMIFSLFKIAGMRDNTLNKIVRCPLPHFLSNIPSHYPSLFYQSRSTDLLPTVARNENEMESSLNTECQRKETLNMVSGRTSNARKTYKA